MKKSDLVLKKLSLRLNLKLSIIIIIIFISNITLANVLLVPQQYPTIQTAINASSANDTILISSGIYFENINFRGKPIVVKGNGPSDSVIIDGSQPIYSDSASVVTFNNGESEYSILDGITIRGGTGTNTSNGIIGGGIFLFKESSPQIKNCIIRNNSANLGGGIGQWSDGTGLGGDPNISYCVIFNNSANSYGGGIWLNASNGTILNCTIVKNNASNGTNITLTSFAANVAVTNSIIWYGSAAGLGNYNYCDIQGGGPSGIGNINSDPLFCDINSNDFHIASNSPCIGSGQGGIIIGAFDIGCDPIVSVEDKTTVSNDYIIKQNFPNPFNSSSTIEFSIPEQTNVIIKLFDLLGKEVTTLVNEEKTAGIYKVEFNESNLPTGVYFYRIEAGRFSGTKKLIILK